MSSMIFLQADGRCVKCGSRAVSVIMQDSNNKLYKLCYQCYDLIITFAKQPIIRNEGMKGCLSYTEI